MKIGVDIVEPDATEQQRIATALTPDVEAVLSFNSAEAPLASLPLRIPAL